MIERTFQNIPKDKIIEADQRSFLMSLGWSRGITWEDLMQSKRILMISEAGAGKTHECRAQAQKLWDAGDPAFFIELSSLANEDLRGMLDPDEEARLDEWLVSQSDIATFFLDSIDELKITQGSFRLALKRLKKCIGNQLHRTRIVITSRPVPFDEKIVRKVLPIPSTSLPDSSEDTFAEIATGENRKQNDTKSNTPPQWRSVALMPLSDDQIVDFARDRGVDDPSMLFDDLRRRNAQEFARRPQDLIELCADWLAHKRIRTHLDQIATNVRVKLLPRDDRLEPAELSVDKAIEGASRLALAVLMTRRLTIRHSAASDDIADDAALEPSVILSDWQPNERKALLERPLFGFASYGRVRFHNISIAEYLAAERLSYMRKNGMPFRALKRLIFAETKGKTIVRPSKRPLAGWLALKEDRFYELLRDHEPSVLLDNGDPESLSSTQRSQALRAYSQHYGTGGWRGLRVPYIQIHRLASPDLATEISSIWQTGIENPDVRRILLDLIELGKISACADIVYDVAQDIQSSFSERINALDALIALDDKRLSEISVRIAEADDSWTNQLARSALIRLFPEHMSAPQLCEALGWVKPKIRNSSDFSSHLPKLIAKSELDITTIAELRDGLLELVSDGLEWGSGLPRLSSNGLHLVSALAATCERGLDQTQDDSWLNAASLTLRLFHRDHGDNEVIASLQSRLSGLSADENERLFWLNSALLNGLQKTEDSRRRFIEIAGYDKPVSLIPERDQAWVHDALSDKSRDIDEREILLEAALWLSSDMDAWRSSVDGFRTLIIDAPKLLQRVDDWLKPTKDRKDYLLYEKKQAQRRKQHARRKAKNHASWVQFWREISKDPDKAFSSEHRDNTIWNLWRVMCNDASDDSSSDWNRRLLETYFDKETADSARSTLMKAWRDDKPTLSSERPDGQRNTFLSRWRLGLAGIYAEAEDANWINKISDTEAELVARYVPLAMNGFPYWVEALVQGHPASVDNTLGSELEWELAQLPEQNGHSFLLRAIDDTPSSVARIFLPRIISWLDSGGDRIGGPDNVAGMADRTQTVIGIILKYGNVDQITHLKETALSRLKQQLALELRQVWLSAMMNIDPSVGVEMLETQVKLIEPAQRSEAVSLLAKLFGDHHNAINLDNSRFTPQLLLRLTRLAYAHVRTKDDVTHEGAYTPDARDDAERARSNIVGALLDTTGEEGWDAKLEMASDPLCVHFKDRILAVAAENWAQEIDADIFDEAQAVTLDKVGEAPATTNQVMFSIMKDRLFDLDDLLLRDDSPREAWAKITDEKVMRREIARELRYAANSLYTVDQEAVTADEKETDIRMRSTMSDHQAVIELKLGDERSANDLLDTIGNQLVKKYMAAEHCRSGALLITLAKERQWQNPDGGPMIRQNELLVLLQKEAERIQEELGGVIALTVHLLDLRPRLLTEKASKGTTPKSKV